MVLFGRGPCSFGMLLFLAMLLLHLLHVKDFASYHLAVYMLWVAPLSSLALLFFSFLVGVGKNRLSTFIFSIGRALLMLSLFFIALSFLEFSESNLLVIIIVMIVGLLIVLTQTWFLSKTTRHSIFDGVSFDKFVCFQYRFFIGHISLT